MGFIPTAEKELAPAGLIDIHGEVPGPGSRVESPVPASTSTFRAARSVLSWTGSWTA